MKSAAADLCRDGALLGLSNRRQCRLLENLDDYGRAGTTSITDARTLYHDNAIVVTSAMAAEAPNGKGSRYTSTYVDKNGDYLDGGKTYKLRVPPNVPVREFWSVTVYDPVTRSQLQTGQNLPRISSQNNPPANSDGSVDIYFAPEKGFFPFYRFYGPLRTYNDQTWKPEEIEPVL